MPSFFTHYWANQTVEHLRSQEGELLDYVAGNQFRAKGIEAGDVIYVVTVRQGHLYLVAKLEVGAVCNPVVAAAELGCQVDDLWEADEFLLASRATPTQFDIEVPSEVVERLRFVGSSGQRSLVFKQPGRLDQQTLRGVRKLTIASAQHLDALVPEMQPL